MWQTDGRTHGQTHIASASLTLSIAHTPMRNSKKYASGTRTSWTSLESPVIQNTVKTDNQIEIEPPHMVNVFCDCEYGDRCSQIGFVLWRYSYREDTGHIMTDCLCLAETDVERCCHTAMVKLPSFAIGFVTCLRGSTHAYRVCGATIVYRLLQSRRDCLGVLSDACVAGQVF